MDHDTAIRLRTSERYLLGELSPGERDEFEEHYFECPECADDVRQGAMLRANARAVFQETGAWPKPAPEPRASRLDLFRRRPVFAASALLNLALLVLAVVLVVRPGGLTRAQFYASYFVPAPARSGGQVREIPRGARMVGLFFDLTEDELRFPAFSYRLLGPAGEVRASETLPAPPNREFQLYLAVPVAGLKPGTYQFVFSGVDGSAQSEIRKLQLQMPD
ncbi:MAG: zf-HC2 domain-containing protein [Bryobacterales bacterium]|nr:zf-HC2 domain-containing protein [Bryobacterales bacterium]